MSFRGCKIYKPPIQKCDIGKYDTAQDMDEIRYTGDYVRLIKEMIQFLLHASKEKKYFRIKFLKRLYAYIRIFDVYLFAVKRVQRMVDSLNKKGKNKPEKVYVLGENNKNAERYFMNAELLGYPESHSYVKSEVGNPALKAAVNEIFNNIKSSAGNCRGPIFTLVYMCCEGSRFIPIFDSYKNQKHGVSEPWVFKLVPDWEKLSKLAREKKDEDTYTLNRKQKLTEALVLTLKKEPAWAFAILSIRHGFQNEPSPRPLLRLRGGSSSMERKAYHVKPACFPHLGAHRPFKSAPAALVYVPKDSLTNLHQGYGFVESRSEEVADYASQDKKSLDAGANLFVGNLDPVRWNEDYDKSQDDSQHDGLVGVVKLFALALERVERKIHSTTSKQFAAILLSVSENIHSQLQNVESKIQNEVGKLANLGKSKRMHPENQLREQQEQLKGIYEKFKEEVDQHLEKCQRTLEGLETHQVQVKGMVEKQKVSHKKFLMQTEAAIETQLNDAHRRIADVHRLAKEKMLTLKKGIAECLKEGLLG